MPADRQPCPRWLSHWSKIYFHRKSLRSHKVNARQRTVALTRLSFLSLRRLLCTRRHRHRSRLSCHVAISQSLHVHQEATLVNSHLFRMGRRMVARLRSRNVHQCRSLPSALPVRCGPSTEISRQPERISGILAEPYLSSSHRIERESK